MPTPILMPKLSFVVTQGTIIDWLKKPGDSIIKGEPLLIIESEKSTMEIEASGSGILGTELAPKGTTVPVTTVIGYILEEGEDAPPLNFALDGDLKVEIKPVKALNDEVGKDVVESRPANRDSNRAIISPLAKRLAKELGIDLKDVRGSGPGGRIVQEDVQAFADGRNQAVDVKPKRDESPIAQSEDNSFEFVEMSTIQKITAERMTHSFQNAPHFYLNVQVNMAQATALYTSLSRSIEKKSGIHLSYSDILLYFVGKALVNHPSLNAAFENEKLIHYKEINPCLAVATSNGLTVPVFTRINRLSLTQIAQKRVELVERARENRLSPDELSGGTFTITNLGMFGIDLFNAVINPPQAAILAVGRIIKRPVVIDDILELCPTMWLSLSVDHRCADGATAAKFLQELVANLENPYLTLV